MAGRNAQGSKLLHSYGDTASSYVLVENVTNIAGPNGQAQEIDVSDLESTAAESVPGLANYGTVTVDLNWRGATKQVQLYNMFSTSADPEYFKIAMPTDSTRTVFDVFSFQASVQQCNLGAQVNGKQTAQIVLKTSGSVVLTQSVALANLDD
jgi:hypothetical protein